MAVAELELQVCPITRLAPLFAVFPCPPVLMKQFEGNVWLRLSAQTPFAAGGGMISSFDPTVYSASSSL